MKRPHHKVLFLVFLAMGLLLTVPAEDLAETAYDESEGMPYETTPLISETLPQAAAATTPAAPGTPRLQSATPLPRTARRHSGPDVHRSSEKRATLAVLCTLLC
jgi:hypothetical protein